MTSRFKNNAIGYYTIVRRETKRFLRIWQQTLLPPVITTILYFMIFGNIIGHRVGNMGGVPYITFIMPGLIMLSVINQSYNNVVGSFYGSRFQKSIEEILVSPLPNVLILLGYVTGGVARGLITAILVTIVASFFTHIHIYSYIQTMMVMFLTALLFSLVGLLNGIFANSFDDITIIPTFVLTPLTYLGGVFYSIHELHGIWYYISLCDPILYIVNAFRHAVLGISDVHHFTHLLMIIAFIIALFIIDLRLLSKGKRIRA